jgi:hypothetical protein
MQYFVEITDTYGGEANYSWVTRHKVEAASIRGAIWKISRASGLNWRKSWDAGGVEGARYDSKSGATCLFIEHWDEAHENFNVNTL